ncbi:MAG TPA: UbiD family decarboxylase [Chloroflexota bacterium]|nr:UbiD family decarboxylase [Chloroflexota bacterium]
MLWQDLRAYLAKLDELGELRHVAEAGYEEDIGGITELITEQNGPSLLFDEIPGFPPGYRVASNLFTTVKRTALALGLPGDLPAVEVAAHWRAKTQALKPVPTEELPWGPVLENVLEGDAVDLFKFPTPKWHENDGGRYIGTGVCVIQRDPDTGVVNSGAYRVSIHDRRTLGIFIEHGKDGDRIRRAHWARGEKCPVAISVGQDPVLTALAGPNLFRTPENISEFEVAGYLQGGPYPVVRARATGLPIPAYAEIVIEGFMPSPDEALVPEGPFGEWTGYYAHGRRPETIVEVAAIYHRNDPIIFGAPPIRPVGCRYFTYLGGDDIASMQQLDRAKIPGVQRIFQLAYPSFRVVALKQLYPGHVDDVIRVLVPGGDQYNGHHMWVIVDDDIDITNEKEVLWAIASRCAPEHGVRVVPGTAVWQLDPRIPPDGRSDPNAEHGRSTYVAHDLVINACRPYEWADEFPPVAVNGPELRARIQQRWKELFAP